MKHLALLSISTLAAGLAAQSNTVAGLDGRLTVVNNLTYWGRQGGTHPNGEVGMSMLNTMCNPGSVNIPWFAAMQPNHPMFGFIICRIVDDRIEQINEWSFCKHAFTSVNVNGSCGTCQNPGTGSLMGLNCADTYSSGNNGDRTWLGPPGEIDPWLCTWDPVGSYFDIGDPAQGNYPAPADGNRSLSQGVFSGNSVKNRVTVQETDLLTANAEYFYGIQLLHQGEAQANRWDNLAHRGFTPNWTGSNWTFNNNNVGQEHGTILDRWQGATVEVGDNNGDDGRIYVACKVTPLGSGNYHYEYAVHNVDCSRAAATLRLPIDPSATATNFTFRDIDGDAANDWTAVQQNNEIVFTAGVDNPLEWNTIYNFGFDADFLPGLSTCELDCARPGPGASFIEVQTQVPGGSTIAQYEFFGDACDGSTVIPQPNCAERNPAGGTLSNTLSPNEYAYLVSSASPVTIESFDFFTSSTGGSVTLPAHIYLPAGSGPQQTPIASTTITIDGTADFYRATFNPPVSVTGTFFVGVDTSAQTAYISDLNGGSTFVGYQRNAGGGWSVSVIQPSYIVNCVTPTVYERPTMSGDGLPEIGQDYDINLSNALPSSLAVLFSGLSETNYQGTALPAALQNAPGCMVYVSPEVLLALPTSATGDASYTHTIPNNPAVVGVRLYHQWAVLDQDANARGIALSNAAAATVGS